MNRKPLFSLVLASLLLLLFCAVGAQASVNKSLSLAAGESSNDDMSSVNGGVTIGEGAHLEGDAETVNGSIKVGDDARVRQVGSVNGSVRLGMRVTVGGEVSTVNGSLRAEQGTVVEGDVETVNGSIALDGTTVRGNIQTVNGGVTLDSDSQVTGSIILPKNRGSNNWSKRKVLEIRILDGSLVEGDIDNRDDRRPVRVVLEGGGAVNGEIHNAEVVRE